jgi:uncharacterized RDD family membrane protein YckC
MENISIQTTQNVDITYEVAPLGDRIIAALLDYIIFFALLFVFGIIVYFIAREDTFLKALVPFLFGILLISYDLLCEIFLDGQSFGKKAMKIKVVMLDGSSPSLGAYFLRWLLRLVDFVLLTQAVGIVTILVNGKGQRIGDIAAGTTVIKLRERITLADTLFVNVEETYTPVFPEVASLSDDDIDTINETLKVANGLDFQQAEQLRAKIFTVISTKLSIKTDLPPVAFLKTIIKDYNAVKGNA